MKKKILFLMPSLFIGGAERSLLALLEAFDFDQYEVDLFLFRHEGEFLPLLPEQIDLLPEIKAYGTFDVPIKKLLKSRYILYGLARLTGKAAMKLHCFISRERKGVWMSMQYISRFLQPLLPEIPGEYDLAVSFLGIPDTLLYKVQAKKKICWNHTDYTILFPDHAYDRRIYRKLDRIVSVSEPCTEQFLKVYPEFSDKAMTVENLLSPAFLEEQAKEKITDMQIRPGEICILSIGRFSDAKNFDNVPDICMKLRKMGLPVHWFLIGYGGEEALIRRKIAEADAESYVTILGKKSNPYPYIKACDYYIQPSRYEGKAVTVREAQILHKPVIITNYATAGAQLENGQDGVIVPMDNEGCAKGIAAVLRDPVLTQRIQRETCQRDYSNRQELGKILVLIDADRS